MTTSTITPIARPTTTPTTPATHYTLSVELSTLISPEGEPVELVDLIARDAETGTTYLYVGPCPCGTHSEALDIIARVFAWEYRSGQTFSPTRRAEYWIRLAGVAPDGPAADPVDDGAGTPSVWAKRLANVAEVAEVVQPVKGKRARRVDAGKARRAKGKNAAGISA